MYPLRQTKQMNPKIFINGKYSFTIPKALKTSSFKYPELSNNPASHRTCKLLMMPIIETTTPLKNEIQARLNEYSL